MELNPEFMVPKLVCHQLRATTSHYMRGNDMICVGSNFAIISNFVTALLSRNGLKGL